MGEGGREANLPTGPQALAAPAKQVLAVPAKGVLAAPVEQVPAAPAKEVLAAPAEQVPAAPAKEVLAAPAKEVLAASAEQVPVAPAGQVLAAPAEQVPAAPAERLRSALPRPEPFTQGNGLRVRERAPRVFAAYAEQVQLAPPPSDLRTPSGAVSLPSGEVARGRAGESAKHHAVIDRNASLRASASTAPLSPPSSSISESAPEEAFVRDPSDAPGTDLGVEASPSAKAPPQVRLEGVENKIGSLRASDKGDSPAIGAGRVYPAALVAQGGGSAAILQRPGFPIHDQVQAQVGGRAPSHAHAHPHAHGHAHAYAQAQPPVVRAAAIASPPAHLVPPHAAPFARRADEPAPTSGPATPAASAPPFPHAAALFGAGTTAFTTQDAALFTLAPPPPPPPTLPSDLLAQAVEDLSLRATILPERAMLSVDTGSAGELALHLRIKDGVADVRVSGAAAETLEVRSQDLRAALAGEGLTLGTFDSGQSSSSSSRHADTDPADHTTDPRPPQRALTGTAAATDLRDSTTSTTTTDPGVAARGVHVTA